MFASIGLFREIPCPEATACLLPNCIFLHKPKEEDASQPSSSATDPVSGGNETVQASGETSDQRKRRRVEKADSILSAESNDSRRPIREKPADLARPSADDARHDSKSNIKLQQKTKPSLASSTRPISPPPRRNSALSNEIKANRGKEQQKPVAVPKSASVASPKRVVEESLNPRLLAQPPASHAIRAVILQKLHEQLKRLNDELAQSSDPDTKSLLLSDQDLIKMALDEEEKVARESPSVYSNVIKLRIVHLKKTKVTDWKEARIKAIKESTAAAQRGPEEQKAPKPIETGLTPSEELSIAPRLLSKQDGLQKFGYVIEPPTPAEIASAKEGVESARGWEQCDRCRTRFQVFPGRREADGALTSGGKCSYHHGRILRPSSTRMDATKAPSEVLYTCCNEVVGTSSGCSVADTHVYKISDPKRLASVLQFERTPPNSKVPAGKAYGFDCEMGYTVHGLELIRLTLTAWPGGEEVLDVLVRPIGEILDLNSRFSGVWPEHFATALPYEKNASHKAGNLQASTPSLRVVPSPAAARSLLFEHLSPQTPLIGHALENDLVATRIIHPSIIDTVLLYPHPKGLPIRYGLKMLVAKHLHRLIQTGGERGHDSKEDARSAGDLVRFKVAECWQQMRRAGWSVSNGIFYPPAAPLSAGDPTMCLGTAQEGARKRDASQMEDQGRHLPT
ncbi:hypothetical protein L228DRAFT_246478 [Xylona heveae TC161]|uniref:Exonuclease domain-containing protein n=1 Tax=Xylona heveae (strain CBS 132557 / TC161) TaxID=1328760 RepID=A0A165HKH2_XYLHT|nr:hypothetical protein L228DRAFT_246478 [Xylona heveae TC161]KZF23648.1 hypothetical protein L228DRAFT_246478 [Xylona heveae TC161]